MYINTGNLLEYRDGFIKFKQIQTDLVWGNNNGDHPLITIAIPTYKRPLLLQEAVKSALSQITNVPFEVIVIDNDP
jgi:hypothetical protein